MPAHILLYIITFQIGCARTGDEDDIIGRRRADIQMRKCRSDNSAATVTFDCFADLFGGGYSDSKVIIFIFKDVGNESG